MRILAPLRSVPLALLWGGLSLSAIGDQLYSVALTWIAVGVLGPLSGYLSALQAAINLASVLGVGRWVDHWEPRASMIRADLIRAGVLAAVVAAWLITGRITGVALVVAIGVLAVGQSIFVPALQSLLPKLTPDPKLLPATNALLDGTDRSARLLGPGLVGLLSGLIPIMHFLTIDGLTFLCSAIALTLIGRLTHTHQPFPTRPRNSIKGSLAHGIRAVSAHPLLGYFLAATAPINGAWYAAYYLCLPLMIFHGAPSSSPGKGLATFGLTLSAYGCANLASTIFFGGRGLSSRPQMQMFIGNLLVGVGIVLLVGASFLPIQLSLAGFIVSAAVGGIGGPMKDIPLAVLRQAWLPPGDVAAGMRSFLGATYSGILIAMAVSPLLIRLLGTLPVIAICGLTFIGVATLGFFIHGGRVEGLEATSAQTHS